MCVHQPRPVPNRTHQKDAVLARGWLQEGLAAGTDTQANHQAIIVIMQSIQAHFNPPQSMITPATLPQAQSISSIPIGRSPEANY